MVLQPGVIALALGSSVVLLLLIVAAALGLKILFRWDITSSSEEQLALERRTYLVSTLVTYGLLFEILSVFLFIYTADDMHNLLVGAMCATGSLNANSFGFPTLYAKTASLFLSASWIAMNNLDNRAEDYPLTRRKYMLLLLIVPVSAAGFALQMKYFGGIDPSVITSCCGVLFSEGGGSIGSSLASLPVRPTEVVFFSLAAAMIAAGAAVMRTARRPYTVLLSLVSVLFFFTAVASVISFISLYFYQLPTHHCPFDILDRQYYYAGYPLYGALFSGSFFGVMAGIAEPFKKIPSLAGVVPGIQKRWALLAVCSVALFVLITLVPMVFLPFTLEGY